MDRAEARQVVYDALDIVNTSSRRGAEKRMWSAEQGWYIGVPDPPFECREDLILVGRDSVMKSIELVELIANIEKVLEGKGHSIRITDDKAYSVKKSPFRSVGSIIDVVVALV